jgi:hypothetical protein
MAIWQTILPQNAFHWWKNMCHTPKKELGECKCIAALDKIKWNAFLISDIFDVLPGKRLVAADTTPGKRPFIGALDNNNGVVCFDDGTPDYSYMEQYAKNLILRKYKQYLAYLDSKEETVVTLADN